MSDCHNGGICLIYNQTGYCKSCKCPTGYTGSLCETAPTVIKVDVTYTSLANSSNKSLNKTAIISLVSGENTVVKITCIDGYTQSEP